MRLVVLSTENRRLKKCLIVIQVFVNWALGWVKNICLKKQLMKAEIVVIPKRVGRKHLKIFQTWKIDRGGKVLYDLDDYIWSDSFREGEYFEDIINVADIITVDNEYLKHEIYNRYNVEAKVLMSYYNQKDYYLEPQKPSDIFKVGWLGSRTTFHYLRDIENDLNQALEVATFELHIAGITREDAIISGSQLLGDNVIYHGNYSASEMYRLLNSWHLGLFPIDNSKDGCGRGLLKVFLYLSTGCKVLSGRNINTIKFKEQYDCIVLENDHWKESVISFVQSYSSGNIPNKDHGVFLEQCTISNYTQTLLRFLNTC